MSNKDSLACKILRPIVGTYQEYKGKLVDVVCSDAQKLIDVALKDIEPTLLKNLEDKSKALDALKLIEKQVDTGIDSFCYKYYVNVTLLAHIEGNTKYSNIPPLHFQ